MLKLQEGEGEQLSRGRKIYLELYHLLLIISFSMPLSEKGWRWIVKAMPMLQTWYISPSFASAADYESRLENKVIYPGLPNKSWLVPEILDTIKTNKRLFVLQYIPPAEARAKSINNDRSSLYSAKSDSVPTNKGLQDRASITATAPAASTSDQDPTY